MNDVDLEQIDKKHYAFFMIDQDCGLLQFFEDMNLEFWRGCAFYEFKSRFEDIHKDSAIILIDKVGRRFYTCNI